MTLTAADYNHMQRALKLAEKGLLSTSPNPRVGCVLTNKSGEVIAEGYHRKAGENHAEINALANASSPVSGATAYVTLEPCNHQGKTGPCSRALIEAGIGRVVYGMEDPNPAVSGSGLATLRSAGIAVDGPLLETEARALNPGFIKRMLTGYPLVRCKMAMSLDGRTAMASGESKWITGPAAREDVQKLRARSCAVITGVGTVLSDDPQLNVRLPGVQRQPLRVVVDSRLRAPASANVFAAPGVAVLASCRDPSRPSDFPCGVWSLPDPSGQRVDLSLLLKKLADEGSNEVLIEAGADLAGAFLAYALVDELVIYMAAKLMGSCARPLFNLKINTMSSQLSLSIRDIRAVGGDWKIIACPDSDS
ncbi:MAG: bifunctional diaminohydroxyphosphoribosylaminopyrimidine deaminase/5-amino-6-(5-phosphoribosylamino)uracil reductase RibD [Cellvibrionaceae bacterium]|nr:bifunctional diaminohydroxyphosphoribosylaminopyrimidine deaminase/5-amino-6-(5-phosphoribosylamino)uracil reductase RibD [Cellvibrionaceae bacterium]